MSLFYPKIKVQLLKLLRRPVKLISAEPDASAAVADTEARLLIAKAKLEAEKKHIARFKSG